MKISEFINNFKNHPVLFIGTGMSLRYLNHSYTWDDLLKKICLDLTNNEEKYLDIKASCYNSNKYNYEKIASILENEFNKHLEKNRNGEFKVINDIFYENMKNEINLSRFKIYISELFKNIEFKKEKMEEIIALKKVRKNIGSIITTNYDQFIEKIFEFNPLIGNNILLSNPYGSVYKIHGCVTDPKNIIITSEDYEKFHKKYELIRAQLLSLFIHNPIIFLGYNVGDENIKNILKTIFTYISPNSNLANKIRTNFLLVEFDKLSQNTYVNEHDINLSESSTIRINKIKTDNFIEIYDSLSKLQLPVSAMDIRKVQSIVKDINEGGSIKVHITEDIDSLSNDEKVLVIGTKNTITYSFQTVSEMMINYFNIIEEENFQLLELIDKQRIQKNQYFPIYGFSLINPDLKKTKELKTNLDLKIEKFITNLFDNCKINCSSINDILSDETISKSNKINVITYCTLMDKIKLVEIESYLKHFKDKKSTEYRKMLCAYDFKKYKFGT